MFADRVALVTGGSAGIGLSVVRKLAAAGARVAVVARTRSKLDEVVASVGERAVAFPLDVADLRAVEKLPADVASRLGRLDYVVNNAGVHHRGPMMDRSVADLEQMVTVNLTAPIVLTRAAIPVLQPDGAIVNVASLAGFVPVRDAATYSATKAGLRIFARAVNDEMRGRGIRICTVSPGPVDTDFFGSELDRVTPITFSQPMRSPDDVAEAVIECLRSGREEIALPWFSGKLATLGYLSPRLLRLLRPMMERLGAKKKAAYMARKAALATGRPR